MYLPNKKNFFSNVICKLKIFECKKFFKQINLKIIIVHKKKKST